MRNNHATSNLSTVTEVKTNANETFVMNALSMGWMKLAYIPVSTMQIDLAYQRLSTKKVDKISSEWNKDKCDPVCLSYRDDVFFITDGQHRYLAALRNGVTHLPAIIRTGLTQRDEARIFVSQNDNVSKLTPYDTFKGNILLGDKVDCTIENLSKKYHLTVKNNPKNDKKTIGSLTEARNIVKTQGKDCLDWIYNTLFKSGWLEESGACSAYIIRSLRNAYINNINDLERTQNIICDVFKSMSIEEFRATAVLSYATRDHRLACQMLLMDKIKEEYVKTLNKSKMTKQELVKKMVDNQMKVVNN